MDQSVWDASIVAPKMSLVLQNGALPPHTPPHTGWTPMQLLPLSACIACAPLRSWHCALCCRPSDAPFPCNHHFPSCTDPFWDFPGQLFAVALGLHYMPSHVRQVVLPHTSPRWCALHHMYALQLVLAADILQLQDTASAVSLHIPLLPLLRMYPLHVPWMRKKRPNRLVDPMHPGCCMCISSCHMGAGVWAVLSSSMHS